MHQGTPTQWLVHLEFKEVKQGKSGSKVVLTVRIMQRIRSQRKCKGLDLEPSISIQNFVAYSLDVIEHFTSPTKKLPSPVLFVQCDILGLKVSVLYLAFKEQALVVQTVDSAMHWINHYSADKY